MDQYYTPLIFLVAYQLVQGIPAHARRRTLRSFRFRAQMKKKKETFTEFWNDIHNEPWRI